MSTVRKITTQTTITKMGMSERNRMPDSRTGRGWGKREMWDIDDGKAALVKRGGCTFL